MRKLKNFKSGATSIYVVVIATLLFSVITVSFIKIIISEANRTTSDELAQAAYDSALAGVEDAKIALKKYYECRTGAGDADECTRISAAIDASIESSNADVSVEGYTPDCDGVAKALGRLGNSSTNQEVIIQETNDSTNTTGTVQAYTCVMLNDVLEDYRSSLSSESTVRVVPLRPDSSVSVNEITGVQISWFSQEDGEISSYNFKNKEYYSDSYDTPPTISAEIIQTTRVYKLTDFDNTSDDGARTDRGTVFLTPTDSGLTTHVQSSIVAKSNDHRSTNDPVKIRCRSSDNSGFTPLSDEFGCTASIEIPAPIGASLSGGVVAGNGNNSRSSETFYLILSLPYGQPTTSFSVQLCTDTGSSAGDSTRGDCRLDDGTPKTAKFSGVQISIDSTGRANDMYSRVESRVEFSDVSYPFPQFALQATGGADDSIRKNFYVTTDCWLRSGGEIINCNSTSPDGYNTGDSD